MCGRVGFVFQEEVIDIDDLNQVAGQVGRL